MKRRVTGRPALKDLSNFFYPASSECQIVSRKNKAAGARGVYICSHSIFLQLTACFRGRVINVRELNSIRYFRPTF